MIKIINGHHHETGVPYKFKEECNKWLPGFIESPVWSEFIYN